MARINLNSSSLAASNSLAAAWNLIKTSLCIVVLKISPDLYSFVAPAKFLNLFEIYDCITISAIFS